MEPVSITAQDMAQLVNSDAEVRLKAENVALRRRIAELETELLRLKDECVNADPE